jgi:hypothetical protein
MSDDAIAGVPERTWPPRLVTLDQFEVAAINDLTASLQTVDCRSLQTLFEGAFGAARAEGRREQLTVLQLLAGASSIVLRPSDRGAEWGPWVSTLTHRAPVPEDFRGEQSQVLAELAASLSHPGLRARLADIAWTNDRKLGRAAAVAIEAYCECAERLMGGHSVPSFNAPGLASDEALPYVERALLLGYVTRRKRAQPARSIDALKLVYDLTRDRNEIGIFIRAARLGLEFDLLKPAAVASDAEMIADRTETGGYPLAASAALDLAAQLHEQAGDAESRRRCQLKAVEHILRMRSQVSGPGAEAHWVQTALFALRHVRGTEARRQELRRELRDLQEDSLGQMGQFSVPLDVGDERDRVLRSFDAMDLPTALRELACLSRSRPIEELRQDALKSRETSPLSTMMGSRHLDADGKSAAQVAAAPAAEEPDEEWFKATINKHEGIRRHIIVMGRFEPARLSIAGRFAISERHLLPIVQHSPFVREDQAGLMSLGFTRLLQGDYRSAVHLLVPQLEPSLRYVLRLAGHDPTIEFDDMTEEDVGLTALLGRLRPQLEECIPAEVMLELDLLFHNRPGSALRHALAHGLLGTGGCFSTDAIYACWLLYQLTCAPLLADWSRVIAPAIGEVALSA